MLKRVTGINDYSKDKAYSQSAANNKKSYLENSN
jgi:hypothetical protein